MQLVITYDPDTYRISLFVGGMMLSKTETQNLYAALNKLADSEPDLLASIEFDGTTLVLQSHTDNAGKVLASLHMYLEHQTTNRELSAAIWFELLEREEMQIAYDEHVYTTLLFGNDAEIAALE